MPTVDIVAANNNASQSAVVESETNHTNRQGDYRMNQSTMRNTLLTPSLLTSCTSEI